MNTFKKIGRLSKYIFLSIILLVFALVRAPFGSNDNRDGKISTDKLSIFFSKIYADAPNGNIDEGDGGGGGK